MTKTLANGYSSESSHRELSNEYQHDRVLSVFKSLSIVVLWMKVASALEGLKENGNPHSSDLRTGVITTRPRRLPFQVSVHFLLSVHVIRNLLT